MNKKKNKTTHSKTNTKNNINVKNTVSEMQNKTKAYDEYMKFYKDNFLKVDDEYVNLKNYLKNYNITPNSYERRLIYIYLAYYFNFDTVNTITSIFKIKSLISKTKDDKDTTVDTIFGFGFYDIRKNEKYHNIRTKLYNTDKNIIPKFIIINGGYDSRDGEYRNGLITHQSIDLIQSPVFEKYHLSELLYDIKNYIKQKLYIRGMGVYEDFFYPSEDVQMSVNYKDSYENIERVYIYFSFAWFKFFNDKKLDIIPNHLNKKYIELFTNNETFMKEDESFFNSLCNKYSKKSFIIFRYTLNNFINFHFKKDDQIEIILQYNIKYGQKLIPLSISEVSNPFSIIKKPWREYLISLRLSDYVLNNVSPGFAITNTWFYIKNSRKGLFDNEIQYDKLERSEIVEQISILLKRAQKYASENEYNKYTKSNKKIIKSFVVNKFKTLAEKINDPIVYANDEILMSNVALNIISEYVGRTFYDMVILSQKSLYYNELLGNPFGNFENNYFKKYMFEICYNILCLNQKGGIIHGDLHLNNVTGKPSKYNVDYTNLKTLYIIDNENYYLMPNNNYNICIIDFSRSVISPDKINLYIDESLPKSFNSYNNLEKIQKDQIERLINIYTNYTNSSTNIDELRFVFSTKFEAVFKLLTVVDIYGFTKKLATMFSMKNVKTNNKCITFINTINSDCKIFLYEYMNKLILDNNFSSEILEMDYPLKSIIQKNFMSFRLSKSDHIKYDISDIFNMGNELKYSSNILEKYAPFMTLSASEKTLNECISLRKDYEKLKKDNMSMINFIANRQYHKKIS